MSFVVMLLACLLRRRLDAAERLAPEAIWAHWVQWTGQRLGDRYRLVLALTLGVAVAAMVLAWWLRHWLVPAFVLDLAVLLVLMGVTGWRQRLDAYGEAWHRGDMHAAWLHVRHCLPGRDSGETGAPERLHLALSRRFLATVFEQYFLIIFWYLVGGIGLAVLARALVALRNHWPEAGARAGFEYWVEILAWIPARLLALTFGLAGDLAGWVRDGGQKLLWQHQPAQDLIMAAANSSLTGQALDPAGFARLHPDQWPGFGARSLETVRALLNRSLLIWICVLAALVITGVL